MEEHSTAAPPAPAVPPLVAALLGLRWPSRGLPAGAALRALRGAGVRRAVRLRAAHRHPAADGAGRDRRRLERVVPPVQRPALRLRRADRALPARDAGPTARPRAPYVAVVDGVQLPRSSREMPGTGWLKPRTPPWRPGIHRAQRFLHLAALLPRSPDGLQPGAAAALGGRLPAPGRCRGAPRPARSGRRRWRRSRWLRAQLDAAGRAGAAAAGAGGRGLRHGRPVGGPARHALAAGPLRQEPCAPRAARPAARAAPRGRRASTARGRARPPHGWPRAPAGAGRPCWCSGRSGSRSCASSAPSAAPSSTTAASSWWTWRPSPSSRPWPTRPCASAAGSASRSSSTSACGPTASTSGTGRSSPSPDPAWTSASARAPSSSSGWSSPSCWPTCPTASSRRRSAVAPSVAG